MLARVCVFAGSNGGRSDEYRQAAGMLGDVLARRGIEVVYGGARVGLMGAVADAALAAGGRVIGVLPEALVARELAHPGLTALHIVESMHARKALMAGLSDAFVALPGGWGTLDELFEALTWGQLGIHRKPCALLNVAGYFDPLVAFLEHSIREGFVRPEHRAHLVVAESAAALPDMLHRFRPPVVEKWLDRPTP